PRSERFTVSPSCMSNTLVGALATTGRGVNALTAAPLGAGGTLTPTRAVSAAVGRMRIGIEKTLRGAIRRSFDMKPPGRRGYVLKWDQARRGFARFPPRYK